MSSGGEPSGPGSSTGVSTSGGEDLASLLGRLNSPSGTEVPIKDRLTLLTRLAALAPSILPLPQQDLKAVFECLRRYVFHNMMGLRCAGLRTLRSFVVDSTTARALVDSRITYFVARSLERGDAYEIERLQAVKLIHLLIDVDASVLSRDLMAAVVATASQLEDRFSRPCIELLCNAAIKNPGIVVLAGGLKTIVNSILEPTFRDIARPLTLTFLYVASEGGSREYVEYASDIGALLAPLSDIYVVDDPDVAQKRELARVALLTMLKCWPGLILLGGSKAVGLEAVVKALELRNSESQGPILRTIFEIFHLHPCEIDENTTFQAALRNATSAQLEENKTRHNLLDCFMAVQLTALVQAGLFAALVDLGIRANRTISIPATILLGELLYLASRLLPKQQCASLQALPSLVASAASFATHDSDDSGTRARANALLGHLNEFGRVKKLAAEQRDFYIQLLVNRTNRARRARAKDTDRFSDFLGSLKVKIERQMDEGAFQALIRDSSVLTTKEHTEWEWNIISELLSGPLTEQSRLLDTMAKTKFVKRLLSFFRPNKEDYPTFALNKQNQVYTLCACQLLTSMLESEEGVAYLRDSELISQIAELLDAEAKGTAPLSDNTRVFSEESLSNRLAHDYFTLLGLISSFKQGQELLNSFGVYSALDSIMQKPDREYITRLAVVYLDYNVEGRPRILLAKAMGCMTCKSREVRLAATRHMRTLFHVGVNEFEDWGTALLVQQLNDPDEEISDLALSILNEACDVDSCLTAMVSKKPSVQDIGAQGQDLLLRFMSSPEGYRYLLGSSWKAGVNWIESNLNLWHETGLTDYVIATETSLARASNSFLFKLRGSPRANLAPHFYGELVKTAAGCERLRASGHFGEFCAALLTPDTPVLQIKAAIWAIGHIGASETGLAFLDESGILPTLTAVTESSAHLGLRGTGFYALCLIASTPEGQARLGALGWESSSGSICVPADPERLFSVESPIKKGSWPDSNQCLSVVNETVPPAGVDETGADLIKQFAMLANHISADAASRAIKKVKRTTPAAFTNPRTYSYILKLLATYKYKPAARRFMYDLFEVDMTVPAAEEVVDTAAYLVPVVV